MPDTNVSATASHSDTVVIRSFGAERFTFYPRDLESMIVRL